MKLTLHLKQLRCHTFSKALTKAPSRGKEHAAHVVMTKVNVTDALVPSLEPEPEAAVGGCPDVRDMALSRLRVELPALSECTEERRLSIDVRDLLRLWKDGIGLHVGLHDGLLLLIS